MDTDSKAKLNVIEAVRKPLNFFTLSVLLIEAILGNLAVRANGLDFTILVVGMLLALFVLIIIVAKKEYLPSEVAINDNASSDCIKRIFDLNGLTSVKPSFVKDRVGNISIRKSDTDTEKMLPIKGTTTYESDRIIDIENPTGNLIVIGSPRYNSYADQIQEKFDLQFQFVNASYDANVTERFIRIVSESGDEFSSSKDQRISMEGCEVDYGILFIADLTNSFRLIWLAGIHGAGTHGVANYLTKHADSILSDIDRNKGSNKGVAYLVRAQYVQENQETQPTFTKIELIGDHTICKMKQKPLSPPNVVACDLGNVLMYFDRNRTYRAIAHVLGVNYEKVRNQIENSDLRERYE